MHTLVAASDPKDHFVPFDKAEIERSVPERFEQQVSKYPDRIAVKSRSHELTYEALNRRANRLACAILSRHPSDEGPIAILLEPGTSSIVALLGTLKAGKIWVPLDTSHPEARNAYVLQDSGAVTTITDSRHLSAATTLYQTLTPVINLDALDISLSDENPDLRIAPDAPAYILYTSGTTGRPKGVLHSHRSALHSAYRYTNTMRLCADDRLLLLASHTHVAGVTDIFKALLNGAALFPIHLKEEGVMDLADWIERQGITIYHSVPTVFRHFVDALSGDEDLSKVRIVHLGGEAVTARDVQLCREHFARDCLLLNNLGATEISGYRQYFISLQTEFSGSSVPAGYPVEDIDVLLLDQGGQEVGLGQVGEIAVRSRYLATGYWRQPELTQAAFRPSPAGGGEWIYRTGDLGILRPDGCLEYLGRKDSQVKIRGQRVEVSEIEAALNELVWIREAVVDAREDESGQKWLVAYFVPAVAAGPTVGELREALSRTLPSYMIPLFFVRLNALPVTPSGKVDRQALPEPDRTRPDLEHSFVAPRSSVEEVLAGIWAEVLGLARVGIHDDFFELGGHSLRVAQVVSRIRDALRVSLPMRSLFDRPTIAGLAELIETEHRPATEVLTVQPVPREEHLRLSLAQEPMWLLDQLEPGNPAYNLGKALRLRGPLHVGALGQSLNEIVRRHESLRTNFAVVDGQPAQVISPALDLALPIIDLEGLPVAEQEARVRQLVDTEAGRPFDLENEPLVRAKLLRLGAEEHVLSLCIHHLVHDGWSTGVLFRELSVLYGAFTRGEISPLTELPIQYADYAIWHRQWLQGRVLDSQLSYWKQRLGSTPPNLELPTDRPRPAVQTYRGARRFIAFPEDLYRALKALSQRERCTPFMILLAAFKTLLYRYTGQDDIVVGSPIAGRNWPELEGLIGLFLNMLVLRIDLSGNPTFRELLAKVREVTLAAYGNQDVPFQRLVEALQPPRDPSRSPLFQVMLEVSPMQELELEGLSVSPLELDNGSAQFDLSMRLREGVGGVRGHFEYNTDLFDAATVDRIADHFQTLLEGIARDSEQRIAELPLLSESEKSQLLVEWNDTRVDYPHHLCLHQLFEAQAERTPEAAAVCFDGQTLTYREFNCRANQLAHYLRKLGVGPETLVGVYMERSLEMVIALYGILKAGGAYVPLDPEYPADRVAFMLQDAQAPVLLTQARLADSLPGHSAKVICLDSEWETLAQEDAGNPASGVLPDNLAYVIYTSGSTGRPKGAMNTHRGICNRLLWMQDAYQLTEADRVLQKTPFSFDVSVWEFFWPLLVGARLVVARPGGHRDSAYLASLVAEQGITTLHFVPSMLQLFLEESGLDRCASLRRVICSGEALPYSLQQRFFERLEAELHNLYGPTEAAVDVTFWQCQPEDDPRRIVPIGRPVANTQLYILDRCGQPVPIGVAGELHIGGVQVARGYVNRPELTAEKFIPDPFSNDPQARLYKTGDLARYRPDGNIEYLGRLDFQVKVRGFRIELGEIEAVLSQHPAVREAVVLAREEVPGDKRLVAYVVPVAASTVQTGALRDFLHSKLPDYMVPAAFVQLQNLPLLPNGKVDRRSLPAPEWERQPAEVYVPPGNELEKAIADIWQELLQVDKVGMDDSFFELGGHSLLLVQAHRRLSGLTDRELSITDMFRFPTIRALTEYLSQEPEVRDQSSGQWTQDRVQARRQATVRRLQKRQKVREEIADERS